MCKRLGSFLQRQVLDRFFYLREWVVDAIVWLAIRLTAYEVSFADVKEQKKPSNRLHADLDLGSAGDLDGLIAHAKTQVDHAIARRATVTEKCKTLFTFNTALLALIAVFQGRATDLSSWETAIFCTAVLAFVVALVVIWTYFDVGGEITIPLEQELVPLGKDDLKKSLINKNIEKASDIDNRTDYLVDLYRTSRFYMMFGFVLLFVVFSHSYYVRTRVSDTDRILNQLRADPRFEELVREAK
jgi:hypothetical protein